MLDHLADLESDFSRFHGIDDIYSMPGPKFLAFCWRIAAYDGMMARRIEAQNHKPEPVPTRTEQAPPAPARSNGPGRPPMPKGANDVSLAAFTLMHPDLVQRTRVSRSDDTN